MKPIKIGFVMDPVGTINPKKDTTLAFMLEAQSRGWQVVYMEMKDLFLRDGRAEANMRGIKVMNDLHHWFEFSDEMQGSLGDLDIIQMRKDPPFDTEYIMATYILEIAESQGAIVVNRPQSLRDANEKVFTAWFPQCCPPSLLTRSKTAIQHFLNIHKKIVLKPTFKMGGQSVFVVAEGDPNTNVIIEEITGKNTRYVQAQAYVKEIEISGDKRIILIDGDPVEYGVARIPSEGDHRGNLAAGATAKGFTLTARDHWICEQIGPSLKKRGILFAGIDVIGDYLTEINITSPTCVREIDALFETDIAFLFFDVLDNIVRNRNIHHIEN